MVASARTSMAVAGVPYHLAVIMDGNGRWAESRGLPRRAGHRHGIEPVRTVVESCADLGIRYLTLFAFSSENWNRPEDEIHGLMSLFLEALGPGGGRVGRAERPAAFHGREPTARSRSAAFHARCRNPHRRQYPAGSVGGGCLWRPQRPGQRRPQAGPPGCGRHARSGRDRCGSIRCGTGDGAHSGRRLVDPDRQRPADQQFPVVEPGLQRTVFFRCALARVQLRGTESGHRILRKPANAGSAAPRSRSRRACAEGTRHHRARAGRRHDSDRALLSHLGRGLGHRAVLSGGRLGVGRADTPARSRALGISFGRCPVDAGPGQVGAGPGLDGKHHHGRRGLLVGTGGAGPANSPTAHYRCTWSAPPDRWRCCLPGFC